MKNFKRLFIFIFILLICLGIISLTFTSEPNTPEEIGQTTVDKTPSYGTMVAVTEIANNQLLENAILDLQVSQQEKEQDVVLHLQSSEFMDEDTLLKDTYNMLQQIKTLEAVATFTFVWHMLVRNDNIEVLTLTFSRDTLQQLPTISYRELASIASYYHKHESLH
ncbi:hypothetical protein [Solibacillus sp. FSL H8-0538]|uniref:hypothetical protein n=1 Tax=Solibacillus sp. FSL H8-0538 TaxID=2921400 RepID=UPI0030F679C9